MPATTSNDIGRADSSLGVDSNPPSSGIREGRKLCLELLRVSKKENNSGRASLDPEWWGRTGVQANIVLPYLKQIRAAADPAVMEGFAQVLSDFLPSVLGGSSHNDPVQHYKDRLDAPVKAAPRRRAGTELEEVRSQQSSADGAIWLGQSQGQRDLKEIELRRDPKNFREAINSGAVGLFLDHVLDIASGNEERRKVGRAHIWIHPISLRRLRELRGMFTALLASAEVCTLPESPKIGTAGNVIEFPDRRG